ncbi:MAG: nitrite/sulfite reductase [Cyanobacteria bacterium]|nr:nitrite/sulfite reductase [Cyanobacteriota bacterium]MDA1020557.1 nitrite/sulfite reductase [Cyanobacteriota bacterium]
MSKSIEELKTEVGGLEVWSHIEEASKIGYQAVNPDLVPLFKWYGIYAQKPNAEGYFMMRIKVPGGKLTANQLRTINDLTERYARGVADITTRQAVQLHWLRIEDMPTILQELKAVGMDTAGGCGDILRNVTGCPLAGLIEDEIFDASNDLVAIDSYFTRNKDFANLPRKYKMTVTGCTSWCSQPDINCIALVGVKHPKTGELGYGLKMGGGLSTKPMISRNFPVFVPRDKAKEVTIAATKVYRDNGFRDKRHKARIKFLIEDWGVDKFLEAIEAELGYSLERVELIRTMETGAPEYFPSPKVSHQDHLGINKLKNGHYAVGLAFVSGRSYSPDFANIASLIEKYCKDGEARTTNKQNLIIVNVLESKLNDLIKEAQELGLKTEHSAFTQLGVACTGTEFCNLAIVETKTKAKKLFDYLDKEFPGFAINGKAEDKSQELMISVTGCPNNCAQYSIADIGLVGAKIKTDSGEMLDAFRIFLGGRLGNNAQFGKALDGRFLHADIDVTLSKLLQYYTKHKKENEFFRDFVDRIGTVAIQSEALAQ